MYLTLGLVMQAVVDVFVVPALVVWVARGLTGVHLTMGSQSPQQGSRDTGAHG